MKKAVSLWAVAIILSLAAVQLCTAQTQTLETEAEENVYQFIIDVLGIDTAKYDLNHSSYSVRYPSTYGGSVKEESVRLVLNSSDASTIRANVIIKNGHMGTGFFYLDGPVEREQEYNVSSLEKAKNMLSRYERFFPQLGIPSQVSSAITMLASVTDLADTSVTDGNMNMVITCWEPNENRDYHIKFAFYYTDNGVVSTRKCISLSFVRAYEQAYVVFADVWGLYNPDFTIQTYLSESEARAVAWEAARNYQVKMFREDESIFFVSPVWSESPRVESSMVMVPGQLYNDSLAVGQSMGSKPREGTTLYPFWKFLFYCQPIGGLQGVQVGVWGDTKEIAYCDSYGHYGGSSEPEPSSSAQPTAFASALPTTSPSITAPASSAFPNLELSPAPTASQAKDVSGWHLDPAWLAALAATVVVVLVVVVVVLLKRKSQPQS